MFKTRFNFVTLAGIQIGIDISWIFIAILLSWSLAVAFFPIEYPHLSIGIYWLMGILGMLGLFICISLHELGHALVAKHYNLPISQITLFIFGGMAEIKQEPESPKVEFLMAIAGPIVSFILSACMYFLTYLGEQLHWSVIAIGITSYLTIVNIILALFNLIPAFPLDGGRILRAILWGMKKNLSWATKISTNLGQAFGLFLIILGIFLFILGNFLGGVWFAIIGLFLRHAAISTQSQFYVGQELRNEKVEKFMKRNPDSVPPDITVKEFIDQYVYQSHHHFYPITGTEGDLLGYISLYQIKGLSQDDWTKTTVKNIMIPVSQFQTVTPNTSALDALNLIHQSEIPTLLVVEGHKLVGILTAQDLFKRISLKIELEEEARR